MKKVGYIIKISKITISVLTMCFFACAGINAQHKLLNANSDINNLIEKAKCSKWESAKKGEGVDISYRWLSFGDTLKTREIASSFVADGNVADVLMNLRSQEAMKQWNNGVRDLNLLRDEDSTWITHIVYDIPYPLSQQDLVIKNTIVKKDDFTIIQVNALPEFIEPINDVNRQRFYVGQWKLQPMQEGKTEVSFSAVSFSKSKIPRFIRDPIIQYKLLNSFIKLKELSANNQDIAALNNKRAVSEDL